MPGFLEHFSNVEDPRIDRCKRHQLSDILFLALSAVLCGADGWEEIEDFGLERQEWLKKFLPYENGIPGHDTIARVMSRLSPQAFQESFINWMKEVAQLTDGEVVAIDGKTVRRSFKTNDRKSAIHMVNAWASANNLVLGQMKVDGKSNEITAIPALLKTLELKGALVTIDAMGCQTEIASQIKNRKADYILAVKGNQAELSHQVKELFHLWPEELNKETFSEIDGDHGRIERRCYRQIEVDQNWLPESVRWAGLKSVIEAVCERDLNGRLSVETRYFISSLPLDIKLAGPATRYHWSVENSLHWVLDIAYREDECRIRRGNGAEVMAALRRLTLNILKKDNTKKAGIQRKRKMAALGEQYLSQLMSQFAAI